MIEIKLLETNIDRQLIDSYGYLSESGGTVDFIGTTRNNSNGEEVIKLEFEAYEPMALKEMKKIAEAILKKWPALRVIILHRVGTVEIGEVAVFISISCAHRKSAFEACQYTIDTLKETVPIWKKEFLKDGEVWVSAHP